MIDHISVNRPCSSGMHRRTLQGVVPTIIDHQWKEGGGWDSNPRPPGPQPGALPTELPPPRLSHCTPDARQASSLGSDPPAVAQRTEQWPSKPFRVGNPLVPRAPLLRKCRCYARTHAPVAQRTEQRPSKPLVGGSNPPRRMPGKALQNSAFPGFDPATPVDPDGSRRLRHPGEIARDQRVDVEDRPS